MVEGRLERLRRIKEIIPVEEAKSSPSQTLPIRSVRQTYQGNQGNQENTSSQTLQDTTPSLAGSGTVVAEKLNTLNNNEEEGIDNSIPIRGISKEQWSHVRNLCLSQLDPSVV
ncbi:MAG: hypothetical protein J6P47_06100, partial [Acetobacter sp.]|nr:hypothetical protein [Acetobacter sp.]